MGIPEMNGAAAVELPLPIEPNEAVAQNARPLGQIATEFISQLRNGNLRANTAGLSGREVIHAVADFVATRKEELLDKFYGWVGDES